MPTSSVPEGRLTEANCTTKAHGTSGNNSTKDYFFEGAEKLLEISFENDVASKGSLRQIPYAELVAMLEIAQCHILHSRSNECMDSYVLSESSMFISDNRIILKTCGTTRLLQVVGRILNLAKKYGKSNSVCSVFYSRKNFLHPERQPFPHSSFESEIDFLDSYFTGGRAYCMGPIKMDQWFLYTSIERDTPQQKPEHTLEIMMTELPKNVLDVFSRDVCKDNWQCREKSGIASVLPDQAIIHDELFDPCGYSLNALLPKTDQYITVHVTPEPDFSYVSFETNQNSLSLSQQILKVINIFRPKKFLLTVFTNEQSKEGRKAQKLLWDREIDGYHRTNFHFVILKNEGLVYAQFERSEEHFGPSNNQGYQSENSSSNFSDEDSDDDFNCKNEAKQD